ncbi:hypothetical protein AIIKEEIJ_02771 [Rhodococcus sp. YH1]|nr:hypothetical protein [Rhodococcus sp. YH1]
MSANLTMLALVGVLVASGVYLLLERSIIKMLLGLLLIGNGINLLILTLAGPAGGPPVVGARNDLLPMPGAVLSGGRRLRGRPTISGPRTGRRRYR